MDATPATKKKSAPVVQTVRHIGKLPVTSANDITVYGGIISQTQQFGVINPAEGALIFMMCYQQGWSLYEFATTFDFMHGKVSKKTDAMISDFEARGGTREIKQRTTECAEVVLTFGKKTYTSRLTWEECKQEPFVYAGRQENILAALKSGDTSRLSIKDKYATPRSRMQMLWARVHSDGIRVVCPEAVKGNYTPEEVDDFDDDIPAAPAPVVQPSAPVAQPTPVAQPSAPVAQPAPVAPPPQSNPELCPPCGNPAWSGQRWDDEAIFSLETLRMALNVQDPSFTPEMKTYIQGVIARREAAQTPPTPTPEAQSGTIPPMPM